MHETILPDIDEALRYSGVSVADDAMREQMRRLMIKAQSCFQPRSVWRCFDLVHSDDGPVLSGIGLKLTGRSASLMLHNCTKAALMVCTLGSRFDSLLREYSLRDMSQALLLNGLGGAWVEALCDAVEAEIASAVPGMYHTDRFSPGYGDLPLTVQSALLSAVNAQRRTGVTLLPSYLMNPEKTVTAILGLSEQPVPARIRGCGYCTMSQQCNLRKRGVTCGI